MPLITVTAISKQGTFNPVVSAARDIASEQIVQVLDATVSGQTPIKALVKLENGDKFYTAETRAAIKALANA